MTDGVTSRVMLALGYDCGQRTDEIIRLKTGDMDSTQNLDYPGNHVVVAASQIGG